MFKAPVKHRDITYEEAQMRFGAHKHVKQSSNPQIETIKLMNDNIIDNAYKSYNKFKTPAIISTLMIALISLILFLGFVVFYKHEYLPVNLVGIPTIILHAGLTVGVFIFSINAFPLIFNKFHRNRLSFNFHMLKTMDISFISFTERQKEKNKVNILALLTIFRNSSFSGFVIQYDHSELIDLSNLTLLHFVIQGNNIIYQHIAHEEMMLKEQQKLEADSNKKEITLKIIDDDIQKKIRDTYFKEKSQ